MPPGGDGTQFIGMAGGFAMHGIVGVAFLAAIRVANPQRTPVVVPIGGAGVAALVHQPVRVIAIPASLPNGFVIEAATRLQAEIAP